MMPSTGPEVVGEVVARHTIQPGAEPLAVSKLGQACLDAKINFLQDVADVRRIVDAAGDERAEVLLHRRPSTACVRLDQGTSSAGTAVGTAAGISLRLHRFD